MDKPSYTLNELASTLGAELQGDGQYRVGSIAPLEKAGEGELSFISNRKYEKLLADCSAGALLISPDSADKFEGNKLVVDNPYLAYARVSGLFDKYARTQSGIHPRAFVDDDAEIASTAFIAAGAIVEAGAVVGERSQIGPGSIVGEDTVVGDDCRLHANVTLYPGVKLGSNVIIHSGTVIGSDGFGFAPGSDGWEKIHQIGGVIIGNRVEIGSNTSIDRGAIENTVIEDGVIIDNLVHIAHNVRIGAGSAIAGCVGIAGSAVIGKNCTVAGMVAINGHITIADNTHFHGGTIVTKGIKEPGAYASASPLQEVSKWRRNSVRYLQLDEWVQKLKALEKAQQK